LARAHRPEPSVVALPMTTTRKNVRIAGSVALATAAAVAAISSTPLRAFVVSPAGTSTLTKSRAEASVNSIASNVVPEASRGTTTAGFGAAFVCVGVIATRVGAVRNQRRNYCRNRSVNVSAASEKDEAGKFMHAEEVSKLTNSVPLVFDNVAIAKILPHRYPFLLVDKVVSFEPGKRAVGVKNVTANEPQFTGHFPDLPIMPGVLMVEAMAQLGGIVCLQAPISDGKGQFFFAGIDGVKFRRPVVPGDTLVMEMELDKWKPKYGVAKMKGKAYVNGQLAVQVDSFTFAMVPEKKEEP